MPYFPFFILELIIPSLDLIKLNPFFTYQNPQTLLHFLIILIICFIFQFFFTLIFFFNNMIIIIIIIIVNIFSLMVCLFRFFLVHVLNIFFLFFLDIAIGGIGVSSRGLIFQMSPDSSSIS
jgi:hypothetical protein